MSGPLPPPSPEPTNAAPDTAAAVPAPARLLIDPAPRAGELTLGWRMIMACTWVGVVLSLAAIWNASVQLGLSTWWLGPRAEPQPRFVQLSPFVAPVVVILGTINNVRRLAWLGLAASGVLGAIAVGDVGRVGSIAAAELVVAVIAALVSVASLTGTYRAPEPAAGHGSAHSVSTEVLVEAPSVAPAGSAPESAHD